MQFMQSLRSGDPLLMLSTVSNQFSCTGGRFFVDKLKSSHRQPRIARLSKSWFKRNDFQGNYRLHQTTLCHILFTCRHSTTLVSFWPQHNQETASISPPAPCLMVHDLQYGQIMQNHKRWKDWKNEHLASLMLSWQVPINHIWIHLRQSHQDSPCALPF